MQTEYSAEKLKVRPEKIQVFKFNDSEELFCEIELLYKNPQFKNVKSDLYKIKSKYVLILYLKIAQNCTVKSFSNKLYLSYILEHGKKICEKNTVFRIGKAITKNS